MIDDFCQFFKDIEKDPKKIISKLKVKDFYNIREHINKCKDCFELTNQILANIPKQETERPSLN